MSETNKKEIKYKILVLGDQAVGKTCFLLKYTNDSFNEMNLSTVGVEVYPKEVTLENGKKVLAQIWDTAGQERFRSICKNYYKGAQGIILMFEVINKESFKNVKSWLDLLKNEVSEKVSIILVGNKIDLENKREVSKEEGEEMAKKYGLSYFETSAKTGDNIQNCCYFLIKKVDEVYSKENESKNNNNAKIDGKKLVVRNKRKSNCC